MSDITKDELKEVLDSALSDIGWVDQKTHEEHHEFVRMLIKKEERKKERWEKVKTQVLGWGIVALIGAVGTWVATHIKFE